MAATVRITREEKAVNHMVRAKPLVLRQLAPSDKIRRKITLPFAPVEVSYEGFGVDYATVDRPGRKPLLEPTTKKLHVVSFSVIVADRVSRGQEDVEHLLDRLAKLAAEDYDCQFVYGTKAFPYRLRVTEFSYTARRRNLAGRITQAEISMTLTERVAVRQSIVALDAIEYEPPRRSSTGGGVGGALDPCVAPPCCDYPSSPHYSAYACGDTVLIYCQDLPCGEPLNGGTGGAGGFQFVE